MVVIAGGSSDGGPPAGAAAQPPGPPVRHRRRVADHLDRGGGLGDLLTLGGPGPGPPGAADLSASSGVIAAQRHHGRRRGRRDDRRLRGLPGPRPGRSGPGPRPATAGGAPASSTRRPGSPSRHRCAEPSRPPRAIPVRRPTAPPRTRTPRCGSGGPWWACRSWWYLGAALAVKESALTSKRIRRDVAARAAQGQPHGRIPYGYRREYDPHTGALLRQVPDPATAAIVPSWPGASSPERPVPAGRGAQRTRCPDRKLCASGAWADIESKWGWRPDQVRDVVASPTAAGLRAHQGTCAPRRHRHVGADHHPDDHALLAAKFADPSRSWTDATAKHLLTGSPAVGSAAGKSGASPIAASPATPVSAAATGHRRYPRFCVPVGWTTSTPLSPT